MDGDPFSSWHQPGKDEQPIDLVIDLGKNETITAFKYLPDQNVWNPAIIANYELYVSADNKEWRLVSAGEFSNIQNNPVWQVKKFSATQCRYIKFRSLKNTSGKSEAGYAEIDVETE